MKRIRGFETPVVVLAIQPARRVEIAAPPEFPNIIRAFRLIQRGAFATQSGQVRKMVAVEGLQRGIVKRGRHFGVRW